MYYTIKKFIKLKFLQGKKEVELQGYSFKDITGGTIIIAYGETRRDYIKKQLDGTY